MSWNLLEIVNDNVNTFLGRSCSACKQSLVPSRGRVDHIEYEVLWRHMEGFEVALSPRGAPVFSHC